MLSGAIFGLALAYFTTNLKMDQFVIGLALFFVGFGLHTLIPKLVLGIQSTLPRIPTLAEVPIPLLSQIPMLGEIFFKQNNFVYFSILLSVGLWYFMYRTKYGLEMRSVGENPLAADSLGINVAFWRYSMTILGGALIGMAGAYLPMEFAGTFTPNIVAGPRLDRDRPDLLRRLGAAYHPVRLAVLRRHRQPGDQGPGGRVRHSLPVPADAALPGDHPGDDVHLPALARAGLPGAELRPRETLACMGCFIVEAKLQT